MFEFLFGSQWKKEPGITWMVDFKTGVGYWMEYDEWRYKSFFRGRQFKSYCSLNDLMA